MKHQATIHVEKFSFTATIEVHHTPKGRDITRVVADNVPDDVLSLLSTTVLDLNDVLYIAGEYLMLTGKPSQSFACGAVDMDCVLTDPDAFKSDVNGQSYAVVIVDRQDGIHRFDVGATNPLYAQQAAISTMREVPKTTSIAPLQ
jgi:hypothetical protein